LSFPPNYPPPPPIDGGYGQPPFQQSIPNYLWQAVVVTVLGVLCCPIGLISSGFGVAALVTGSQIADKQRAGDIAGALEASKRVKTFCIVAASVLGVALLINIIYYIAVAT
jgi:hypothetical protein